MRAELARGAIDPFVGITPDPSLWQADLARPEPAQRFVIYFTPRSSSTRLTEILGRTRQMGQANEVYNPTFVARISRHWKVADMETYIALQLRRHALGGVYSCEVTAHHLNVLFADETAFVRAFAAFPAFWLIRQDIVAQAVSLAKMVKTNIGHSAFATESDLAQAETNFIYDAAEIRHWLIHIRAAEIAQEAYFLRHRIAPLRISYEQMTALDEGRILEIFAAHLQRPVPELPPGNDRKRHHKIGTARNEDFAARFRAEAAEEVAQIEAERAPMLAQLHDLTGAIPTAADLRGRLAAEQMADRLFHALTTALADRPRMVRLVNRLQARYMRLRQRVIRSRE